MLRRLPRPVSCTAVVLVSALAPGAARAQSIAPLLEDRVAQRVPSLIASVAVSPVGLDDWKRSDGPAFVGSLQGRLNRFLVLEGEVTRWTAVDDYVFLPGVSPDRQVWTVGTNLLFRGGTARVTGFAGGGLGVRFAQENFSSTLTCPPGPGRPPICTGDPIFQSSRQSNTSLTPQFLVGAEFWVTQRIAAYGGARFAFGEDQARSTAGFAPLAGLRVALRTSGVAVAPTRVPDPTRAYGKDVRVILNDGQSQRGKLVSFSASGVNIGGSDIPLADVHKIEKVGHATRNAVAIGILAFAPTLLILGPAADMGSDMALAIAAAGVGAGIGVGAVIDAVRKPGNVIYVAPGTAGAFTVRPILASDRRGLAVTTSW